MSRSNLTLEDGDSHGEHTDGETLDAPSCDECCEIGHKDLDEGGAEVDDGAYTDGHASSEHVAHVCGEEGGDEGGEVETCDHDSYRTRIHMYDVSINLGSSRRD